MDYNKQEEKSTTLFSKKKILSFDLDNTLYDDNTLEIPQSAIDAIDRVRDRYLITIATGRDLTLESSRHFLDAVRPDAYVHNNGTQVHIGGKRVFYHLMDKALLGKMIDFSLAHQIAINAIIHDRSYCACPEKLIPVMKVLTGKEDTEIGDVRELLNFEIQTLGMAGSREDAALLQENFPEIKVIPVFEGGWYDIMEQGISKVVGVSKVLEYFGLTFADLTAFGDSMNDLEVLQAAGCGVAMGNAAQGLKDAADYVTDDIDKDGIAKAIAHLCR